MAGSPGFDALGTGRKFGFPKALSCLKMRSAIVSRMSRKSNTKGLSAALAFALVGISTTLGASSALATSNLITQSDGTRVQISSNSTSSWESAVNFNNFDAMRFLPTSYPTTVVINMQAVWNASAVNTSGYDCYFYNGQAAAWVTSSNGLTIAKVGADSSSISCAVTATAPIQAELEIGSARTTGNFGRVRFMFPSLSSGGSGGSAPVSRPAATTKYSGPEILAVDTIRPIVSGGTLTFTGKNLSAVSSATIGDKAASLSFDTTKGLTIGTPAGLAPGKYDLVMQSSFGKLTHLNAVTIKAPTPTKTINFKGDGEYLNETQVSELVAFNSILNSDYEKVRCIVNAADADVAKAIAIRVCAHVARGEARNVEVIQDVRSSYQGTGFWVRVYAKG